MIYIGYVVLYVIIGLLFCAIWNKYAPDVDRLESDSKLLFMSITYPLFISAFLIIIPFAL